MSLLQHQLRIIPHQRTVVASADRSLLDAALQAGLNLPHSCKSGHCSSCRARLIEGEFHYPHGRPAGITAEEADRGFLLLCQARARSDLTVEARVIARVGAVEIKTLPCRIARLRRLAPDVMAVFLRLPAVEALEFQPGQYLDVLIEGDRRRSFSIASPPHDAQLLEIHVRHVAGGSFTRRLFDAAPAGEGLREGSLLRIEGPIGQFVYRDDPRPALLIAGGTGFAPLKSILRHVLERGGTRALQLYWGARRAVDLYEAPLIESWLARYPNFTFTSVLSEAGAEDGAARRGFVHEAVLADHPRLAGHEVYAAGPPAMIEAIRTHFPARGLAPDALYFDSFDYATEVK